MFKEKDTVREMLETIWALAEGMTRGDTLSWKQIGAAGYDRECESWGHVIKKLKRRMLRERGIALWADHSVGLRLLTNSEQVRVCSEQRQKRARRQIKRALREVGAVESSSLSLADRRLQFSQLNAMKHERRTIGSSLYSFRKAIKTDTHPVRTVE